MMDLRLPIGYFFLINGAILVAMGLVQPVDTALGDMKINLNLDWGLVMFAFGAFMTAIAYIDRSKEQSAPTKPAED
jgi:hypothetical protein